MNPDWHINSFNELSTAEVYAILQLRNEVFIVEQNCVYQDADDKDEKSWHITAWKEGALVAYCRVLPAGLSFDEASIGRVVTSPHHRNFGLGRQLMERAIAFTLSQFNCRSITIGAQLYLKNFYESLDFIQISEPYLEDNLLHIKMQLTR